jgi:N-acyl-D-amino-acid deacylase
VFNANTVTDTATYEQPFQYAVGFSTVIVNGVVALANGEREGTGKGVVVKPT